MTRPWLDLDRDGRVVLNRPAWLLRRLCRIARRRAPNVYDVTVQVDPGPSWRRPRAR